MKKQVRAAILAAAALAVVASTQAATPYNGDLVIGFTSASGSDFEFDLGAASSLTSGQQFNLSGQLSGFNLSTVNWGVVGTATVSGARTSWVTVNTGGAPNQINGLSAWSKVNTAVSSIYGLFGAAGAGNSATPNSADDNSWNQQTRLGSIATQYHNVYEDPNSIGTTSADFYSVINNNTPGSLLGTFSLNSNGILTFTAVPEPSSFGLMAAMGLLALTLRRQLATKNA